MKQNNLQEVEAVYQFLVEHKDSNPTYREIAESCGLSLNKVFRYLHKLKDQGRIELSSRKRGGIVKIKDKNGL